MAKTTRELWEAQPPPLGKHPGPWVRDVLLPAFDVPLVRVCEAMQVNRQNLYKVLNGESALTYDMAYKLEAYTGVDGDRLMDQQHDHERALAQERRLAYAAQITRASL